MMDTKREQIVATLSKGLVEPKISVVGCGGAGNNVVNSIYWSNKKVETVAVNTDESKLDNILAHKKVLIGKDVTHGQGARGSLRWGSTVRIWPVLTSRVFSRAVTSSL
jgi:cell division protein FtsZ